jgi:hypothetical protein
MTPWPGRIEAPKLGIDPCRRCLEKGHLNSGYFDVGIRNLEAMAVYCGGGPSLR